MFKKFAFIYLISLSFFSCGMEKKLTSSFESEKQHYEERFPLHQAVRKGGFTEVRSIIQNKSVSINDTDDQGKSALYFACLFREYRIIKSLINSGADKSALHDLKFLDKPDYREIKELLALQKITKKSFESILRGRLERLLQDKKILSAYLLMDKFPSIGKNLKLDWTATDEYGKNLLFYAVERQNSILAQKIIDLGFDVNVCDKSGKPLLFYAVETGSVDVIKILLANDVNLHVLNPEGANALYSVNDKLKNPELIEFLIEQGLRLSLDLLVEALLEMPRNILLSIYQKHSKEFTGVNVNKLDANKFRSILRDKVSEPIFVNVIIDIAKTFIKENNSNAIKFLFLFSENNIPIQHSPTMALFGLNYNGDIECSYYLADFIEKSDCDDPNMFKILSDNDPNMKNEDWFNGLIRLCCHYNKWECAKAVRLQADSCGIDIEQIVSDFMNEAREVFEDLIATNELIQKELNDQNQQGLRLRRHGQNHGYVAFTQLDESDLRERLLENQRNLGMLQEKYDNMRHACSKLEILKEKALAGKISQEFCTSIAEAIDSNNPELFLHYVYQDQSDGRSGHLVVVPKLADLMYAICLNPDSEVAKYKKLGLNYIRERYITNLCAIIDSIFLVSDDILRSNLMRADKQGDTILHSAACYACPEVLEHLLRKLYELCNEQQLLKMINAKNNKKEKKSPLEIALMNQSEEKVRILVYYGADITLLNFNNLLFNTISPDKPLIKFIFENRKILPNLQYIIGAHVTKGLRVDEICDLLENYKLQEERRKQAHKAAKTHAKLQRLIDEARARAKFESAKFRSKVTLLLTGTGVAALMAYNLFSAEKIVSTKTLAIYR